MGRINITMPKFDDINGGTKDLFWGLPPFSPFSFPDGSGAPGGHGYTAKVTGPKVDFFGLTDLPTFTPYIKSVKDANFTSMTNGTFPFGAGRAVVGFKVGEQKMGGIGFTLDKLEFDGDGTTIETKYSFGGIDKNLSLGVNGKLDLGKNALSLAKIKAGYKDLAGANVNYMHVAKKNQHFLNAGYSVNAAVKTNSGAYDRASVAVKYTGFKNQVAKFELNLDKEAAPSLSMLVEFA